MALTAQVVSRIDQVARDAWDQIAAPYPFTSHQWMHATEAALPGAKPYYILITAGDQIMAGAAFFRLRREQIPTTSHIGQWLIQNLIRVFPLLVCRALPFTEHSCLLLPSDPELQAEALTLITREAIHIARRQLASFVIVDYLRAEVPWQKPYRVLDDVLDHNTSLEIGWQTFDEYVQALKKSARKDYNRHQNRAQDLGIQITIQTQITELETALALILDFEGQHQMVHPWTATTLRAIHASRLHYRWLTAHRDNRLVGCGMVLIDEVTHTGKLAFLGIDRGEQYVYFQLAYAAIQAAIEVGVTRLYGGSNAYEFKERIGFQIEAKSQLALATPHPVVEWLVARVI